jgi:hypothetical protein
MPGLAVRQVAGVRKTILKIELFRQLIPTIYHLLATLFDDLYRMKTRFIRNQQYVVT